MAPVIQPNGRGWEHYAGTGFAGGSPGGGVSGRAARIVRRAPLPGQRSTRLGSPSPQPFSAQAENPDTTDAKLKSEPMDSAEAKLASEATEPMEANDPAEPIDSTEPVEPMERIDPLEPIDRIDPDEPMLRVEPPALPAPEELTLRMKAFWHRHPARLAAGPLSPPAQQSPPQMVTQCAGLGRARRRSAAVRRTRPVPAGRCTNLAGFPRTRHGRRHGRSSALCGCSR
jgi:hypothetical protein